jgi:hypothetical protein
MGSTRGEESEGRLHRIQHRVYTGLPTNFLIHHPQAYILCFLLDIAIHIHTCSDLPQPQAVRHTPELIFTICNGSDLSAMEP